MIRKRGLYTLKNYEYYFSSKDEFDRLYKSFGENENWKVNFNKLGISLNESHTSLIQDIFKWLLEDKTKKVEIVELRDVVYVLNAQKSIGKKTFSITEELFKLNYVESPKANIEYGLNRERVLSLIKENLTEHQYSVFLDAFNTFCETHYIDINISESI